MSDSEKKVLGYLIEKYAKDLVDSFNQLETNYKGVGIDINEFLPVPFDDLSTLVVSAYYYEEKQMIEINFLRGREAYFHFNIYDDSWRTKIFDNEFGDFHDFYSLANPILDPPYIERFGFGKLYSLEEFLKDRNNTMDIAYFMTSSFLATDRLSYSNTTPESRIKYLESLAFEFKGKIEDSNTSEKELDDFLSFNKEILNLTLELDEFISEPILKDILEKYGQDLKPDAVAFDAKENKWVIVDYKRSQKKILKNVGKVRTSFKSDVNDLQAQLLDYVEYFQEQEHRNYFKGKYGLDIEYPFAIGIIGVLEEELTKDFNRVTHNLPKWFSLYPYNYLLRSFVNHINRMKKIIL
ncbi:hypothetical protein ACFOU0_12135 [Salinicoccus sesuvii]|uniref:PD-(D/E)XK endonuclease-like domain-containing protein n=1 Tax=Salinicoccus sesuvii TaxID=868281 RepID=A0ABV7N9U3_9STAP